MTVRPTAHEAALPSRPLPVPQGALTVTPLEPAAETPLLLSVIVPTFNEALNIGRLVTQLSQLLDESFGHRYEIIVVDDNSPDRTWELAQKLGGERPRLRVMRREQERGLSTAVIRGWQAARGEVLCVIDADLQHPPDVALALYRIIERGADIAVASRHLEGGGVSDWSVARRIVSRTAQLIGLLILPGVVGRVTDPMSGYFMIRRSAIEGVELNPLGYKILIEVLARGNVPWVGEVPYVFSERALGGSKATAGVYLDYLRHLLRLRLSSLPVNRFIRFAMVGLSGVFIDMGLLFLLSDPTTLAWGLTRSKLNNWCRLHQLSSAGIHRRRHPAPACRPGAGLSGQDDDRLPQRRPGQQSRHARSDAGDLGKGHRGAGNVARRDEMTIGRAAPGPPRLWPDRWPSFPLCL